MGGPLRRNDIRAHQEIEHAINYAEKHNPDRKKVKCVQFLEATESEVCSILNKRMSELREKIVINSKIKILD